MDEYLEHCFQTLSDIFFDSAFRTEDLDKERKVIIEEINMVEDSSEDLAFDLMSKVIFGEHPLGQTILGTIENVKVFGKTTIRSYMDRFYNSSNVVLSFAGNVTETQVENIVKKCFLDRIPQKKVVRAEKKLHNNPIHVGKLFKDFEQSNVIISFPSVNFNSPKTATQSLLNAILGGGMSSRLFQRIREQSGLAYSVFSTPSYYQNCGNFNIVCNITPSNTKKVLNVLRNEIMLFLDTGVADSEFERAKAQLKSAFVFGQESVQSCMITAGKLMLSANDIFDYNKRIHQINAVTKGQLNEFAKTILNFDLVNCAYVGKDVGVDLLAELKR
jgi:predicted Zn-dependent peptidase